ncbi:MAG: aldo/keto reductase [Firmicutes bacterium]|nr:aldo/keto reductase [Bacillota bacterium]
MQYRKFGRHNFKVSALGFGCMRFPLQAGADPIQESDKIDEEKAIAMLRHAIDNGIDYVDTAYPYHKGESEKVVAKALRDGYRERVKLATKLPVWLAETHEDFDKLLDEQLNKLETEYVDFYLLHALNRRTWKKIMDLNVLDFVDRALADGRINYAGFSFHDAPDLFREIVDAYPWSFCQIQYNYLDENTQAGRDGLKYAADKNLAIVIMEPLLGGKLASKPPREIQRLWDASGLQRTPAQWALHWLWNHPEVTTVLSGMTTMSDLEENLRTAANAHPNQMGPEELQIVEAVRDKFHSLTKVNCTQCGYCTPCESANVMIPHIFTLYNNALMFEDAAEARASYKRVMGNERDAARCIECGICEPACPQGIPIIEKLKEAHNYLSRE